MGTKDKIEKLMADPEAAARVDGYLKADFEAVALADLRQGQVTQADLASVMGVSQRRISAIENTANPRIDTLRAYMSKLGYELVLRARSSTGEEIPVRLGG
jgi:transcriptional regulator with XRE-family HTH domain